MAAQNVQNQAALTSGYLSIDRTLDSNPLRSLNKDVMSDKKSAISAKDAVSSQN